MGKADYLKLGENNVLCDICGFKYKSSDLLKTWDGYWACRPCWYPRNPQDFVRGIPDPQAPRLSRPEAADVFTAEAEALESWPSNDVQ